MQDHGAIHVETQRELTEPEKELFGKIVACFLEGSDGLGGWTEVGRRELGRLIYEFFLKPCGLDQHKATMRLAQFWANSGVSMNHDLLVSCASPGMIAYEMEMGCWYASAFPKVVIKSQYAAALVATRLGSDMAEFIKPPWESFIIELPSSVLSYVNKGGKVIPVDHIFVRSENGLWNLTTMAGTWEMSRGATVVPTAELLDVSERDILSDLDIEDEEYAQYVDATEAVSGFNREELARVFAQNVRLQVAVRRLVMGACLAMSDPKALRRGKLRPRPLSEKCNKRLAGLPLVREHVLGKPIKVDCRQAVQDFVSGKGKAPSVQSLVRGHWKKQACGPGNVLRKVIHVEPYWRGPEDAPIVTRPHELEG